MGYRASYRVLTTDCTNGDCPSFLADDATGDVIVRGPKDGEPGTEMDLRFDRDQFTRFARAFLAGEA